MADLHLTFELLAAYDAGHITRRELLDLTVGHVFGICPTCATEDRAFRTGSTSEEEDLPPEGAHGPIPGEHGRAEYKRAVRSVADGARELEEALHRERVRAARELEELLALPHEEAEGKIRRARTRFRSPSLAQLLLAEARAALPDRPRDALERAGLAERVAWRMVAQGRPLPTLQAELGMLAVAHQGNALRILDDLRGADHAFDFARGIAAREGVSDPAVLAEVDSLEGSLRRAQRRFEDAEKLLRRAVGLAVAAKDDQQLVAILLTQGVLFQQSGRLEEALGCVEAALAVLPASASERLRLSCMHNRLDYLCELGHSDLAAELLEEADPLYRHFVDPWTVNRHRWVLGKIAWGTGRLEEAVSHLVAARQGFASADARYDAALVSLEVAEIHLELGQPSDARLVAEETLPLFASLRIPREAAATVAQLRRAVAEEIAPSQALLRRLSKALPR